MLHLKLLNLLIYVMAILRGKVLMVFFLLIFSSCREKIQISLIEEEYNVNLNAVEMDSVVTKERWNEMGLSDGEKCVSMYLSADELYKFYQSISDKKNMKKGLIQDIIPLDYIYPEFANTTVLYLEKKRKDDEISNLVLDMEHGIIYYYLLMW